MRALLVAHGNNTCERILSISQTLLQTQEWQPGGKPIQNQTKKNISNNSQGLLLMF